MRFLDRFDAILFDLNGTLAVDFDRFGPEQDFHSTYRALGGRDLVPETLDRIIREALVRCLARYASGPAERFPDFREFLPDLAPGTLALVEDTIAFHETGSIPPARIQWLARMAATHQLGIVSDQWAPARRLRAYLESSGAAATMRAIVLSCEEGAVKPSPALFMKALAATGVDPGRALFVGDNYQRDIEGAAACALSTVWISETGKPPGGVVPSRIISSVEMLAGLD